MRSVLASLLLVGACAPDTFISAKDDDDEPVVDSDDGAALGQPDIQVTPASLDFGYQLRDCPSDPKRVTIENVGSADLEVSAIELRGPGKIVFAHDGSPDVLAPGDTLEVDIVFTPDRLLRFEGPWLEITSNDPDEGVTEVPVVGEGTANAYRDELFVQEQSDAVDVLFSIDYSGSMSTEIANLGAQFDIFINSFVNLGLDYHIAVITADPGCPDFQGPVITNSTPDPQQAFLDQTATGNCYGEAAFGATMNALSTAQLNGPNAGFLRQDATLAVVAISDEPEQTEDPNGGLFAICAPPISTNGCMPVNRYVNFLNNLKGDPDRVTFSGIVGPASGGLFGAGRCSEVDAAPRYHSAIRQTGGVYGDLCNLDLNPFLSLLSYVAAGLDFRFELAEVPMNPSPDSIIVEVDGVQIPYDPSNGWTYDAATNAIELHGSAIPGPGGVVSVAYPSSSDSCD